MPVTHGVTGSSPVRTAQNQILFGGLAQLARAPVLQAGGQRFESVILHEGGVCYIRVRIRTPLRSMTCWEVRSRSPARRKLKVCDNRLFVVCKKLQQTRGAKRKEVEKGAWRMPRLPEAKKDVASCEKLRGGASDP